MFISEIWRGTKLFKAIEDAAANRVSIGGTSASTAIFGHAAYINLPWDSTNSSLRCTRQPINGTALCFKVPIDFHFLRCRRMSTLRCINF